jgi:hypothetical protein
MESSEMLIDFMDLVDFTLSDRFVEKWRHRYSSSLITLFQLKLIESLKKKKPIKKKTLTTLLVKRHKYNVEEVTSFFDAIELDLYNPVII